jgi:hypothetical protein
MEAPSTKRLTRSERLQLAVSECVIEGKDLTDAAREHRVNRRSVGRGVQAIRSGRVEPSWSTLPDPIQPIPDLNKRTTQPLDISIFTIEFWRNSGFAHRFFLFIDRDSINVDEVGFMATFRQISEDPTERPTDPPSQL